MMRDLVVYTLGSGYCRLRAVSPGPLHGPLHDPHHDPHHDTSPDVRKEANISSGWQLPNLVLVEAQLEVHTLQSRCCPIPSPPKPRLSALLVASRLAQVRTTNLPPLVANPLATPASPSARKPRRTLSRTPVSRTIVITTPPIPSQTAHLEAII